VVVVWALRYIDSLMAALSGVFQNGKMELKLIMRKKTYKTNS
jgi:hypothetical protein